MSEVLKVYQHQKYIDLVEVCAYTVPDGTFERLTRMGIDTGRYDEEMRYGDCLVDQCDEKGDWVGDTLNIADHHGQWLVGEFLHGTAREVKRIKLGLSEV